MEGQSESSHTGSISGVFAFCTFSFFFFIDKIMNKGGAKKFSFGFPSKKAPAVEETKRKAATEEPSSNKKPRSVGFVADDEDDFLASAGIGK